MTALSSAVDAGVLAHGLHHAMVLAGLWGLAALLVPHALTRLAPGWPALDEHDRRVAALRAAVVAGAPGIAAPTPGVDVVERHRPHLRTSSPGLSVPAALVATTAAAGVHAAVAPPHVREQALVGLFLLAAACAQLTRAAAALRPTALLLRVGVVLHLGLVVLWLLTRTAGLPWGLLPEPHPVGAWDLACVAWQVLAAAACARALCDGVPRRCPGWFDCHPSDRAAVGVAAVTLALLTLSGAHS